MGFVPNEHGSRKTWQTGRLWLATPISSQKAKRKRRQILYYPRVSPFPNLCSYDVVHSTRVDMGLKTAFKRLDRTVCTVFQARCLFPAKDCKCLSVHVKRLSVHHLLCSLRGAGRLSLAQLTAFESNTLSNAFLSARMTSTQTSREKSMDYNLLWIFKKRKKKWKLMCRHSTASYRGIKAHKNLRLPTRTACANMCRYGYQDHDAFSDCTYTWTKKNKLGWL